VRVKALTDIAEKVGLSGSTDSAKKLSESQVIEKLRESLAQGKDECSAALDCPLQQVLEEVVSLIAKDLQQQRRR
jgi:molybdopterin converting factor small subunit